MRSSESALRVVEEIEPLAAPTTTGEADDIDRPSVWERVAVVATIFIGFQFALLAVLGL
jgi:hypothetical protein